MDYTSFKTKKKKMDWRSISVKVWHPQVPLKVSVFIRDRLPTKANLAIRGVVPADDILCFWLWSRGDSWSFIFILYYICIFVAAGA